MAASAILGGPHAWYRHQHWPIGWLPGLIAIAIGCALLSKSIGGWPLRRWLVGGQCIQCGVGLHPQWRWRGPRYCCDQVLMLHYTQRGCFSALECFFFVCLWPYCGSLHARSAPQLLVLLDPQSSHNILDKPFWGEFPVILFVVGHVWVKLGIVIRNLAKLQKLYA